MTEEHIARTTRMSENSVLATASTRYYWLVVLSAEVAVVEVLVVVVLV